MFQICWHRSVYAVLYTEVNRFLDMFKMYQRVRAYRIYVTHTLTCAGHARHTLYVLKVRCSYVIRKLSIRHTYVCKGLWSKVFLKFAYAFSICICKAYAIVTSPYDKIMLKSIFVLVTPFPFNNSGLSSKLFHCKP